MMDQATTHEYKSRTLKSVKKNKKNHKRVQLT